MEELRSRLDEKDSTLEKSRRQLSQLKAEKAGLDEEKSELGEALDIKEKKISLLQVTRPVSMAQWRIWIFWLRYESFTRYQIYFEFLQYTHTRVEWSPSKMPWKSGKTNYLN